MPVFNEEQSIEILFGEINNSVNSLKNCTEYEIIFIDDGSTDKSWKIEKEISIKHAKKVRAIRLKKNFGKIVPRKPGALKRHGNVLKALFPVIFPVFPLRWGPLTLDVF